MKNQKSKNQKTILKNKMQIITKQIFEESQKHDSKVEQIITNRIQNIQNSVWKNRLQNIQNVELQCGP